MARNPRRRQRSLSPSSAERHRLFRVGSLVEVRSNEIGFRGAWYDATVVQMVSNQRCYIVSYSSLVADEASLRPLEETVLRSFVRPRPPLPDPTAVFGLYQCVEAFHNEGWWKGVVSKLPEVGGDCSYAVCFPATREEYQFKAAEIRRRLEWVKGDWIPFEVDQALTEAPMALTPRSCRRSPTPSFAEGRRPFRVGSLVEVRSNEIGLRGAWFEATVTQILPKHRSYVVSYSFPNPLKERVFFSLLRPRPPPAHPVALFGLHQCVEAFHYGGWWKGVVSKLLGEDCSYAVCFPTTREEFQFKAAEMRPRLEWVEGNWVPVEADQEGHVMYGEGTRVEVSCDRENYGVAWFVGTVLKVIGKINFLVEYEYPRVGDNGTEMLLKEVVDLQYIRPCPPALVFTGFNVLDEVEGFHQNGWFAGVVSMILPGSRYIVKHKHEEMVLDHTSLRPRCVWDNGRWVHISQNQHCKTETPRRTKLIIHRRKSSASKRSSHPISLLMPSDDDGDVADRPSFSALKRKKADGSSQEALVESFRASKKSKKRKSVEENLQLGNGMIRDKNGGLSIPVTAFRNNDGASADGSDPANLKGKGAMGPSLERGIELSQPGKKLKKEKSLGEHLQLVDETKPVRRKQRSHSRKRSSIPSPVLTSNNTDDEVADMFGAVNLKDRKVVEPNLEYESSHPSKKLDKGISLEKHLKSVDCTLRDCGYKTPETVGKHSTAAKKLTLERSPALVAGQHHLRSSCESVSPECKMGLQLQSTSISKELCQEQGTSGVNGANESIVTGKESSCLFGEGREHKSKEASFVDSPVGFHAANFVPTADWGNGKGDTSPAENTKMRRKKVVARTPKRRGMTPEYVKQHELEEMEEHKGGIPSKNILFMNRMKPKRLEKGTELVLGGEDGRGIELFNQMPTLDVSDSSQPVDRHNKALDSKKSRLTITSEEKPPGSGGISFFNKQADIMEDAHVTSLIESSVLNAELLKCSVVQKSPILKSFLSSGEEIWSYGNKHGEAGAGARLQAFPSREDGGHEHDESTLTGSPADKEVEIEGDPIDPCTGSSPHHEDNVFDDNEFSPSRLLSEKAFVETEDMSPLDPSPKGSLISREDKVADHDVLTLHGSLSERPVIGMEQAPCDPNPCGSLPSNKDTHDHDKLMPIAVPSVTSGSFVNRIREIHCANGINENGRERENQILPARLKENISLEIDEVAKRIGEIQSCVNGLDENGRENENQALPAHFKENIAPECDEFALTTSSGRDIFKGGEKALMGPLPMELSAKSVLPFTKTSELWESVESREVFRMLPQQPHFCPLLQYGKRFREGMALGLMVTFAKLMTDISSLRIVDSQLEFEEKLKALGPLESNGFNIQPVRARLEKLLGLRSVLNQSEDKKHSLRTEVQELEAEKEHNSVLMFSVENVISELKQKLTALQDKRESMLLDIRKNDAKLDNLKTSFQAAEEASTSIERQFSCALTAPW